MINDIGQPNNPRNGKALAGIILLVIGAVLLIRQFTFFFIPHWLFSWPMWLIFWGLFVGAKSNFQKPSSFALILIGVVFLLDNNISGASAVVWPIAIIAFGLWMILRRNHRFDKGFVDKKYGQQWDWKNTGDKAPAEPVVDYTTSNIPPKDPSPSSSSSYYPPTGDEYLDTVSVFGGVKKTILSKDFRGGDVVNIFGGAELDLTQADINGRIVIDIVQIFGSTKIIVPSNWHVVTDIAAVFAGIDDKRMKSTAAVGSEKILVLKGVSIFAGVDIRSY
ncbi:LiaF transmembrane domain-containing protein [Mucilaginibacter sp.]|uniref:LiaF transmembrane domain-containing protein n=1 Tax=Mucilaginibacter sp. TaxID=1882438 RepID=UPI003D097910